MLNNKNLLKNLNSYTVSSNENKFEGTFAEFIKFVSDDKIIPVIENDKIIGVNYPTSETEKQTDANDQFNFQKAYNPASISKWANTIYPIKALISELFNYYFFSKNDVKLISDYFKNEFTKQLNTYSNQYNKNVLNDQYILPAEEISDNYTKLNEKQLLKAIKTYFKKYCGYFLKKGCNPNIEIQPNNYLKITNISWGRKLSKKELAKLN